MSIDTRTSEQSDPPATNSFCLDDRVGLDLDWQSIVSLICSRRAKWDGTKLFGPAATEGGVYRWGWAVSNGSPCNDLVQVLSRMACGAKLSSKRLAQVDLGRSISDWYERVNGAAPLQTIDGTMTVLWSAALPSLVDQVSRDDWRRLLGSLLELHEAVLQQRDAASPSLLMVGAEAGMTLAARLRDLPPCYRLRTPSAGALSDYFRSQGESVSGAIRGATDARLVLASLIRSRRLVALVKPKHFDQAAWNQIGAKLSTWVAAMTTPDGRSSFSNASKTDVVDDVADDGLLQHAARFDAESLKPAIEAALGATPTGGRLTWQISLPESMQHDDDSRLAALLPDWDVRRGRTHIDYSTSDTRVELHAGRARILSGHWETMIEISGQPQHPCGEWAEICDYSDDEVHYLEIEQPWSGNLLLQRQFMLLRDDHCVLFADAVLPANESPTPGKIRYTGRIPLASNVQSEPEDETREIMLHARGRRALVLPLSASEWRIGATRCTLNTTEDHHLAIDAHGTDRLYVPLWFDLQHRRFQRRRTWRQLTVADQLRVVANQEAVGYRIQLGSEQWCVYRSLAANRCRSVLGKHLNAGFYCSRFDSGDGSHEELITVDDSEASND